MTSWCAAPPTGAQVLSLIFPQQRKLVGLDSSVCMCVFVISLLLIVLWHCFAVSVSAGGPRAVAVETEGQRGVLVLSSPVHAPKFVDSKMWICQADDEIVLRVCITDAAAGARSDKTERCQLDSAGCYRT